MDYLLPLIELLLLFGYLWIIVTIHHGRIRKRLRKLSAMRHSNDLQSFYTELDFTIDEKIAESVFETIQVQLSWAHIEFPVRASDRLRKDYDLSRSDLRFIVEEALLDCDLQEDQTVKKKVPRQIKTVSELVEWLNRSMCPPKG